MAVLAASGGVVERARSSSRSASSACVRLRARLLDEGDALEIATAQAGDGGLRISPISLRVRRAAAAASSKSWMACFESPIQVGDPGLP